MFVTNIGFKYMIEFFISNILYEPLDSNKKSHTLVLEINHDYEFSFSLLIFFHTLH